MPLYEYKCKSCGDVFEVIQKFSDQPLSVHEKCGGMVERLISPSALQFKGSGWYVNDYGKGNSKEPASKPDSKNGKTEKSNGTSTGAESSGKSENSTKTESSPSTAPAPSAPKSDGK
jgi:putative FmdB family regulatory protein